MATTRAQWKKLMGSIVHFLTCPCGATCTTDSDHIVELFIESHKEHRADRGTRNRRGFERKGLHHSRA